MYRYNYTESVYSTRGLTITPVIITNSSAYREVIVEDIENSGLNQTLFTVVK
ncbi:hypothetical protein [Priestia megaterium]|uniref:hypothetical protein n=1 Tax=Priestia megaterium TaxID=1404 RepID=UPI00203EFFB5|nr:hypothetical protein [Priestia megaterium]MCM3542411.1 hypothetical protein [Priestia megaterium]MEC1069915.1 hypothetical protein [Priestia megaterium]